MENKNLHETHEKGPGKRSPVKRPLEFLYDGTNSKLPLLVRNGRKPMGNRPTAQIIDESILPTGA